MKSKHSRQTIQQAQASIRAAIKAGQITTERAAAKRARQLLPGIRGYEITVVISDLLPKTVQRVLFEQRFRHSWFQRTVRQRVFEDVWGRIWSSTSGIIRKAVAIRKISKTWSIDALGGMMWTSMDKKHFICEYRTSEEEALSSSSKPESFVA